MTKDFVQKKLLEFGITPNLIGFHYICDAIEVLKREENKMAMYNAYEEVSKKYNCSRVSVERSIGTAVRKVDFSLVDGVGKDKMTNNEFLYFLLLLLNKEEAYGE